MRILIACEESQRVCAAFRIHGHEAYSCDLLAPSGGHPEWHKQDDCLSNLDGQLFRTMDGEWHFGDGWDMMIAHPPCTYLSLAGARWLYPHKGELDHERYRLGLEAKAFFLRLLTCNIPKICIENPMPMKIFGMPEPTQIIQPYQFGHPVTKKTLLWLKNLPPLHPTEVVMAREPFCPSGTSRKIHEKYGAAKRGDDRKNRSKTFPGIALAMAEQWG